MDWTLINVFFTVFSGWLAIESFKNDSNFVGWLNVFASALNGAAVAARLL